MGHLIDLYADRLLQFAVENDKLQILFRQACAYLGHPLPAVGAEFVDDTVSTELNNFLDYLDKKGHGKEVHEILEAFVELARKHLGIMAVEVISAVPLTQQQMHNLHVRLIRRAKRPVQLIPRVDPSLVAGIRLVGGGTVMDTSVKQQLADMKESIYKGVYTSG